MKLVKVSKNFYELLKIHKLDDQLMYNEQGRPCVLLVKLKYNDTMYDFVAPLRSNISSKAAKWEYFSLPPNSKTREHNRHGIHYIKLFPIVKEYIDLYKIKNDIYFDKIIKRIQKNEKQIITSCQDYLDNYSKDNKHPFTPNIDAILNLLYNVETNSEAAATNEFY